MLKTIRGMYGYTLTSQQDGFEVTFSISRQENGFEELFVCMDSAEARVPAPMRLEFSLPIVDVQGLSLIHI